MISKKKILTVLLTTLVIITSFSCISAENKYIVADASLGKIKNIEGFETLKEADNFYEEHLEEYNNLIILDEDKVIKMEYGVIEFMSESCSLNNNYSSIYNGTSYLNSCYASEAAYLSTDKSFENVYFKISDDVGKIALNEVRLVPYEMVGTKLSTYIVQDNYLYHNIKTSLSDDYYAYNNKLDFKPEFLKENKEYFSYDGHYFYKEFKTMIDDYNNETFENAINSENGYYNYYMYLPHRSYTNYNKEDVEDYFVDVLHIDGKIQYYDDLNYDHANDAVNLSQLYDEFDAFFGYENIYGANALMMLALATHESAYGKSYLAFTKNNLFGHAAYDSDTERNASRYNSVETSVYSHAKYFISRLYAGIYSKVYFGSFFGDKKSGMNVLYSSDPYWSEKVAGVYFNYDEALGLKDKDSYSIGIIKDKETIRVYKDKDLSSLLFSVNDIRNYSFIILDELDDVYKVQVDPCFFNNYIYDPETSIGYIDTEIIDYILNENAILDREYTEVHFDLDGGEVIDNNQLVIKTLKGKTPSLPKPYKEGYEFVSYDKELSNKTNEYKAIFKEIKNVEVKNAFNNVIEVGTAYNLANGKLFVEYMDGTNKEVDVNSNMIEPFDNEDSTIENLVINYNGIRINYPYTVSEELKQIHNNIDELIYKNVKTYKEDGSYNLDELKYIKENIKKIDYRTSFKDIRYIDKMLLEETRDKVNYTFKDSQYDVSISGLALALNDPKPLTIFKPFKDTYYVDTTTLDEKTSNKILQVASPYGFDVEEAVKIKVKLNMEDTRFTNPLIFEIKVKEESHNKIYTVYHLDSNGNVIKCNTTWSNNFVTFMCREGGDFLILSKEGINTYDLKDERENISLENADPDNHLLFIEGSIFISVGLFGFIMIIIHAILSKKEEEIWKDYKKSLQVVELPQEEKQKN